MTGYDPAVAHYLETGRLRAAGRFDMPVIVSYFMGTIPAKQPRPDLVYDGLPLYSP